MLRVLHLTSSRFFGGPEQQILGLARELRPDCETVLASFAETGLNKEFLDRATEDGFTTIALRADTPRLFAAFHEVVALLRKYDIDVLICHGYKAGVIGSLAARRVQTSVVAVSRGWTSESRRVRLYEAIDRRMLRSMDRVVCVSQGQADKVTLCGVPQDKIVVIRDSIDTERFAQIDASYRDKVEGLCAPTIDSEQMRIVGAAGRLSPEKGYDVLIDAAKDVAAADSNVRFVLFGDGPLRGDLEQRVSDSDLQGRFVLAGFTDTLDQYMPHFDLFVQSSHTEGLPNVVLESLASGVPVVATDVGGTREIIRNGIDGVLVPNDDAHALAEALRGALADSELASRVKQFGRQEMTERFRFASQANDYLDLLRGVVRRHGRSVDVKSSLLDQQRSDGSSTISDARWHDNHA